MVFAIMQTLSPYASFDRIVKGNFYVVITLYVFFIKLIVVSFIVDIITAL